MGMSSPWSSEPGVHSPHSRCLEGPKHHRFPPSYPFSCSQEMFPPVPKPKTEVEINVHHSCVTAAENAGSQEMHVCSQHNLPEYILFSLFPCHQRSVFTLYELIIIVCNAFPSWAPSNFQKHALIPSLHCPKIFHSLPLFIWSSPDHFSVSKFAHIASQDDSGQNNLCSPSLPLLLL